MVLAQPVPPAPREAVQAPVGRAQRPAGPFKEAIVFMLGGGNYLEYESLRCVCVCGGGWWWWWW